MKYIGEIKGRYATILC